MRRIDYVIPAEYEGRRVVHYLRGEAGCSAALVKALKQTADGMLLNGVHTRTIDLLHAGDRLSITVHDTPKTALQSMIDVPVLYEDDDVIVFNKPPDMPCHPSKRHQEDTLANVFARICAQRNTPLTCRIVNRLDRNTSGAVLIAKNAFAAAALVGRTEKVYFAVTAHVPQPPVGRVDAPIGRPDPQRIERAVMPNGQRAVTEYRVFKKDPQKRFCVVRCTLPTGRTHQIRVHMAHIGCPLLGDDLYGGDCSSMHRQALHCAMLSFLQPVQKISVTVRAPLPQDMQNYLCNCPESW